MICATIVFPELAYSQVRPPAVSIPLGNCYRVDEIGNALGINHYSSARRAPHSSDREYFAVGVVTWRQNAMCEVMNPSPHVVRIKGVVNRMFVEIELKYGG